MSDVSQPESAKTRVAISLGALVFLAGCLGDRGHSSHYTLAPSKDCFTQGGDDAQRDKDFDTRPSGGWLTINYSDYSVFIGFGADEAEAERLKDKILDDQFFPFEKGDVVRRGNAVYHSNRTTMPRDMREKIEACLK